jgi:hypothetical protein
MIFNDPVGPNSKGCTLFGINSITHRNNQVQTIDFYLSLYRSFSFLLNLCNFCTSCLFIQYRGFVVFPYFPTKYNDISILFPSKNQNITINCLGFLPKTLFNLKKVLSKKPPPNCKVKAMLEYKHKKRGKLPLINN